MTQNLKNNLKSLPKISLLTLLVPVSFIMSILNFSKPFIFVLSALSILGIVIIIGKATEELSLYTNPVLGGVINATFGNVAELIFASIALLNGQKEVALASIIGSIIANLLLLLGFSMVAGGLKYPEQKFGETAGTFNLCLLAIILICMVIPSFIPFAPMFDSTIHTEDVANISLKLSLIFSFILIAVYALSLVFSLKTHKFIFMPEKKSDEKPQWSIMFSIIILLISTLFVIYESHLFVGSIESIHEKFGISKFFIGGIIAAIVGNAAEGAVAIWVARENKIDLSFQVAIGSCIQVGLMVAPALILIGYFTGNPITMTFNIFEIFAIWAAFIISSITLIDGKTNWFEGACFIAVYLMIATLYFFHP